MKKILNVLVSFIIVMFFVTSCNGISNVKSNNDSTATIDSVSTTSVSKDNGWFYDSITDEMSDKSIYFAEIISDNMAYFDFPYEGGTNAKLSIRKHPKYGTDVIFSISQGQLLCNDYDGTNYVTVRFDNAPAERYYTNEPMDMSSETLFLRNSKKFIVKAKNAKKIKIQAPVYNNGNVVFTFSTDEVLKWNH